MTSGIFATFPLAPGHVLQQEIGRTRALLLVLLGTLAIGLVVVLATRQDRAVPAPVANPAPAYIAATPAKATLARAKAVLAGDARTDVETLTTLMARRYRISTEATRAMVATAYREAHRVGLDPLLIVAVIAIESRFNPIAESVAGAQGLMQVIPAYHKDKFEAANVDSVLDPHANIRLGSRVLKDYIRRGGTEVAGLQLYNGASDDVTTAYANKVLAEKQRLQHAVQQARERSRV